MLYSAIQAQRCFVFIMASTRIINWERCCFSLLVHSRSWLETLKKSATDCVLGQLTELALMS